MQRAKKEKDAFDDLYAIMEMDSSAQETAPVEDTHLVPTPTILPVETPDVTDSSEESGEEGISEVEGGGEAGRQTANQRQPEHLDVEDAIVTEAVEAAEESGRQGNAERDLSSAAGTGMAVSPPILPQYLRLHEMNGDLFGWICIEGSNVNYPVMYTPEFTEYYIHRAFDGSESLSGIPFVDGRCPAQGNYYLIYGHNMKNKTMFGELSQYAQWDYYEDHPIIHFDTLYEKRDYQVIAAFFSRIYSHKESGVFRYYNYFDLEDEAVFDTYIAEVKQNALYDTGCEVKYGDELLALSTCSNHTENGRFVVVAKRIVIP